MGNAEVPDWLQNLPVAPTYYPTDTEFADPIAYISKIEKEASGFGICKVIPPLPKPSKKYVFSNLNKSLLKFPELGSSPSSSQTNFDDKGNNEDNRANNEDNRAVFTTRHQELGYNLKKTKGQVTVQQSVAHKQVWQSGEVYTLEQFESKAKSFSRSQLGTIKEVTPLVVEALFWRAAFSKPIYIEYANDVPGSGFGEPEEVCQYIHRRRRRRPQFNRKPQECYNSKKHKADASRNFDIERRTSACVKNDWDPRCERQPLDTSDSMAVDGSRHWRQTSSNASKDREGTAGWILSNSPWNLQVIASSPGSLTRFMLDDIPGVTSPMIYIGMLFSWFAWHVEDHELHSLNFLHTGSPKTWYAVPGDYAFRFEEVIRSKGYGGNLDRLAALTLLGEKTNLLSPEVVIASGIPCCRLVQNPGEFVVTFPRAYHIGFSHGFNCGEAANFGTPQWLNVAKEAAVRRAAMNYLPMLSHQQLLYMLTMSFISRVPRALLPGARTSRLKDRQKEERELLVKKAFINDMLNEKNLLSVLLEKESTLCAVVWDPEALPLSESVSDETSTISNMSISSYCVGYQNNDSCNNKFDSTKLSTEKLEDFYVDDDDLPCGLHVDSGALACVACGVLGFPVMSIIQPSWRASKQLFPADCQVTQSPDVLRCMETSAPSNICDTAINSPSEADICDENQNAFSACGNNLRLAENCIQQFYSDAISAPSETSETIKLKGTGSFQHRSKVELNSPMIHTVDVHPLLSEGQRLDSTSTSHSKWNTSNRFLRPRIFCLEHALEIEKLLHSKGGANVLIICHSAYPKIKVHAIAVAEEIGASFDFDEFPLQRASKEDMNLISISIGNDGHNEGGEDWTSRLGLNLRYCVKLRKLSPFKKEQHPLALGGLFSDMFPGLDHLSLKWKSRRSRTPHKAAGPSQLKSCGSKPHEKSDVLQEKRIAAGENKIIQYSRRRRDHKVVSPLQVCTGDWKCSKKHQADNDRASNWFLDTDLSYKDTFFSNKNDGSNFVELNEVYIMNSETHHNKDSCTILDSKGTREVSDSVNFGDTLAIESIENDSVNVGNISSMGTHDECVTEETREAKKIFGYAVPVGSLAIPSSGVGTLEAPLKDLTWDNMNKEGTAYSFETADRSLMQHKIILADETSEISNISDPMKSPSSRPIVISYAHIESLTQDENKDTVCNNVIPDISKMQVENQTLNASSETEATVCDLMSSSTPSLSSLMVESFEDQGFHALEEANRGELCSTGQDSVLMEVTHSTIYDPQSTKRGRSKRRELDQIMEDDSSCNGFIKSPCEGLRPRTSRVATCEMGSDVRTKVETTRKKASGSVTNKEKKENDGMLHRCDIEGCRMSFKTRNQLIMHKCNRCTHKGCGKQFSSHRYALLHQRVHINDRPLKCTWKGCSMSFKWAWARIEHMRVHTGERPYQCKVEGCGLTFRFVSDFSRHRRKSGHYVDSASR